jgi:nucleotide-binding universal stress UspA family protein
MTRIVLAVDGSDPSLAATRALIKHRPLYKDPVEIHLLHVCPPIPRLYGSHYVVDAATIERILKEDAEQAMISSKILFDKWGIAYSSEYFVGEAPAMITSIAEEKGADFIYVGARGLGALKGAILGSTTLKLLQLAKTPVVVIHATDADK